MPSSPNYKRNYKQEMKTAKQRGENKDNVLRKRARRMMVKKGLVRPFDGKEVDHKVALDQGGSNTPANFRIKTASDNRSFPRTKTGSMKKNT